MGQYRRRVGKQAAPPNEKLREVLNKYGGEWLIGDSKTLAMGVDYGVGPDVTAITVRAADYREPNNTDESDAELRERIRYMTPESMNELRHLRGHEMDIKASLYGIERIQRMRSFAQRHKPLAEAFAALGDAIESPRNVFRSLRKAFRALADAMHSDEGRKFCNQQWVDAQLANPPRWALDGRGVARGERWEAFKVGLCNAVEEQEEPQNWREIFTRKGVGSIYALYASDRHEHVMAEVRQYVDQQCGEAPAWT